MIDTLAAAFPGLEENSSEGMSRVVATGRRLAQFGAAVVFVHHSTKDSNGTPRGHSVLNGALDVSMELFKPDENGIARGRLRKNRNGSCERDIAFRIQSHEFGIDDDGDAVTAGYCEPCLPGSAPRTIKLSHTERAAMDVLHSLMRTGGQGADKSGAVRDEDWRAACRESPQVSTAEDFESRKRAVRRVVQNLVQKRQINLVRGFVYPVMPSDDFEADDLGADNDDFK